MTTDPRDLFRGAWTVARRDFLMSSRSPKVVLMSIAVLLAMVGAAFGLAGFSAPSLGAQSNYLLWAAPAYPNGGGSPGVVAWAADIFGAPHSNVTVVLGEPINYSKPSQNFTTRITAQTSASGWVAFPGLGPGTWPLELRVGALRVTNSAVLAATRPAANFSVWIKQLDVIGDGANRDVGIWVVRPDGTPVQDATVVLSGADAKITNANGYAYMRLNPGTYPLAVRVGTETVRLQDIPVREPTNLIPLLNGPDFILYFLAFVLMYLFAPILAIALSYDALAKERAQGSLELLLVRPASRTGIAVGKFLGSFLSVGVPLLGITAASIAAFAGITGKWPDAGFVAAFFLATLALVATYILLMQIFSTLSKSPGTAILAGVLLWVVFNILWSIVVTVAQAALHIESGTPAYFHFTTVSNLLNPSAVYQLSMLPFLPASLANFGGQSAYQIPDWSGPLASAVWILVLLVVAIQAFRKRIV